MDQSRIADIVSEHQDGILEDWLAHLARAQPTLGRGGRNHREDAISFLEAFEEGLRSGQADDTAGAAWERARDVLADLSRSRAKAGSSPKETATFVFSLKEPLFTRMRSTIKDREELGDEIWSLTRLIDDLGLFTTEMYQAQRESIIALQQQELLELSTPVTRLWSGILGVPLIGTLDSARTQIVMESLLEEIVETGASIAVIDITGVPAVDTLVAQHLLKTVSAAKLMGAECIISGIRPQIAQTIVHLGVDLGDVVTKASLADAFQHALGMLGLEVTAVASGSGGD